MHKSLLAYWGIDSEESIDAKVENPDEEETVWFTRTSGNKAKRNSSAKNVHQHFKLKEQKEEVKSLAPPEPAVGRPYLKVQRHDAVQLFFTETFDAPVHGFVFDPHGDKDNECTYPSTSNTNSLHFTSHHTIPYLITPHHIIPHNLTPTKSPHHTTPHQISPYTLIVPLIGSFVVLVGEDVKLYTGEGKMVKVLYTGTLSMPKLNGVMFAPRDDAVTPISIFALLLL